MAIKTITLRPTSSGIVNLSSGTSPDISSMTYPSTDDATKIYLLVNEEVSDGDSTYYLPHQLQGYNIGFGFTPPEEYGVLTPKSIKIYLNNTSEENASLTISARNLSDNTRIDIVESTIATSATYNTLCYDVSQEYINTTWYVLTSVDTTTWSPLISIHTQRSSGSTKASKTKITQLYIEVDFDIEESSGIYVKRNGVMTEVQQMYQKVNGSWTEITADECKTLIQSYS